MKEEGGRWRNTEEAGSCSFTVIRVSWDGLANPWDEALTERAKSLPWPLQQRAGNRDPLVKANTHDRMQAGADAVDPGGAGSCRKCYGIRKPAGHD